MKRFLHLQHSRKGNVWLVVLIALVALILLAGVLNVLGWIVSAIVGVLAIAFGLIFGVLKLAAVLAIGFLAFFFRVGAAALLMVLLVYFVLRALGGMGRGRRASRYRDSYHGRFDDRWQRRQSEHERRY